VSESTVIDVSVKGKWVPTPAVHVGGVNVIATGKVVKIAAVHDEGWMEREVEDPEAIVRVLRRENAAGRLKADVFTFAQKLPATTPKYSYPMEWDNLAAIHLTSFTEWWEKQLPQETRKNTRRAAKRGVVTSVRRLGDDLVHEIVKINNDTPLKQGAPFAHYGKTFEQVKRDYSAFDDRSEYICAHVGDELVGFLRLVYCGPVASVLQLMSKRAHYDKRPANALMVKAVEWCAAKGLSYVVYGKYRYGNQEATSLMEFKDRHGFREIKIPRFYVPLTLKGRLAMKLNLHHDLVGVFPRPAIAMGRRLRSKWYAVKPALNTGRAE